MATWKEKFKERFSWSSTTASKQSLSRDHSLDRQTAKPSTKSQGKQSKAKSSKKGSQSKQQHQVQNQRAPKKHSGNYEKHNWDAEDYHADGEDFPTNGKHLYQKHVTADQDRKTNGWKTTTGHAAEFMRSDNRCSKKSVDSGFGGSFRRSGKRKSYKANGKHRIKTSNTGEPNEYSHLRNKTAVKNLSYGSSGDINNPHRLKASKSNTAKVDDTMVNESSIVTGMVLRREEQLMRTGGNSSNSHNEESDEDEFAIPINLHRDLKSVLREANTRYYIIRHDPDNEKQIMIDGCDVAKLHGKLQEVLLNKPSYNKFSLVTTNIHLGDVQGTLPTLRSWIKLHRALRCTLNKNRGPPISVMELLLKGFDNRKQQRALYDYFGSTTAHSLMTPEQCETLSNSHQEFERIWLELIAENWKNQEYMNVPANSPIDFTSRPFPLFRYWFPAGRDDDHFFITDILIFKLDERQLERDRWLSKEMSSQYGRNVESDHLSTELEHDDVNKVCAVKSKRDLAKLCGRRIICAGKLGRIVPAPSIEQDGGELGWHLTFVLDNNDMLVDGDCGSLVYMFREQENDDDLIIGMFFGTLIRDSRIHQATVLSKALKQLESTDKFHLEGLLPIHSTKEPPFRYDSGYRSARESMSVSVANQSMVVQADDSDLY